MLGGRYSEKDVLKGGCVLILGDVFETVRREMRGGCYERSMLGGGYSEMALRGTCWEDGVPRGLC